MVSRDVERLDKEFDIRSEFYKQFRSISEKTVESDEKEIRNVKIHAKYITVRDNKMIPPSSKSVLLERVETAKAEAGNTYLQPILEGVEILTNNQLSRYQYVRKTEDAITNDPIREKAGGHASSGEAGDAVHEGASSH